MWYQMHSPKSRCMAMTLLPSAVNFKQLPEQSWMIYLWWNQPAYLLMIPLLLRYSGLFFLHTLKLPRGNLGEHSSLEKIGERVCCWSEVLWSLQIYHWKAILFLFSSSSFWMKKKRVQEAPQTLSYHPGKLDLNVTHSDNERVLMLMSKTWFP